ncbi:hypothetical protein IQ07DRAFT_684042 [Pyrenochaeta sp. DS3sAY3a]|nr:hypothetical protein IQ07DRAFT_684042 [Pyrenochaeta sp. DS3sAY3a]
MADPSSSSTTTAAPSSTTDADPQPSTTTTSSPSTPAQQEQQQQSCAHCQKSPDQLKQCLKCHSAAYCNKDCQKAGFKTHKKVCASLAQEYAKQHEPKMASKAPARSGGRERGLQKWQFDT